MPLRRNILIFHKAALGDFIVTWPLALALARMYPQSRVHYVTASSKGKLAERVLGVESIDAEAGWHALFADGAGLSQTCRTALDRAQLIVSFASTDAWDRNVRKFAPEAALVSLHTSHEGAEHVTQSILNQLKDHPLIHAAMEQMLRSVAARGISLRRTASDRIVIHPGAGKLDKCWPTKMFVELIERLQETTSVRVILGEAELERWPANVIAQVDSMAQVVRPASYLELLDEISSASAFIGNDSGPGHLAGIVGVPTVSIFGSSPDRWKPVGPRVTVVAADGIARVTVDEVLRAIEHSARPDALPENLKAT